MRQAMILVLFLTAGMAFAADNVREGTISHCTPTACLRVVSPSLSQSQLDPDVWNFGSSVVEFSFKQTKSNHVQRFEAAQGYVDLETQYLVLKELRNSSHKELLLNLQNGHLIYF